MSNKFDSDLTESLYSWILEGDGENIYSSDNGLVDCYDGLQDFNNFYILHTDNDGFVTLYGEYDNEEDYNLACQDILELNCYEEEDD